MGCISKCHNYQQVNENQRLVGLLQMMPKPEWKWENIGKDFVISLLKTLRNHDSIWVIVDRLKKLSHFIFPWVDYSSMQLAKIHIKEIVSLIGFH